VVAEKVIWDEQVREKGREKPWRSSASYLVAKIPMARFITATGLTAQTRIPDPSMVAF